MAILSTERTYDILSKITDAEYLDDLLDVLGSEIEALGIASSYLVNLLDASGKQLSSLKIRYIPEFRQLEQTYLKYKIPLNDGHLNARVMANRSIERVNETNANPTEMQILHFWKMQEIIGVPICHPAIPASAPLGVIVLLQQDSPVTDAALADLQALLALFYKSLACWLRFSHLEEMHHAATAAVAENTRLLQFLDEMNSLTSIEKIYALFADELFRHLPFDIAAFWQVENNQLVLYKIAAASPKFENTCEEWRRYLTQKPYTLDPTASGAVYVLMRDDALFFPDLQEIRHLPMTELDLKSMAILKTARSLFISPIRYQKKPIGIFALYSLEKPLALSDEDQILLGYLSSFLGTAVTNGRLYATSQEQNQKIGQLNSMLQEKVNQLAEQAATDQLTGLFNFRTFEQELDKRLNEASRQSNQTGLSLALIDVDHFKRFNDTYGHAAGNDVLAGVAREISKHIRQSDMACRYGGEEFVLILPKCDLEGAEMLAERIRSGIEASAFVTCAGKRSVTVSIGCTMHWPGDSQHSLFTRADEALYKAKHGGRNRVCSLSAGTRRASP